MGEIVQAGSDRGFNSGVNLEQELYAHIDGLVYPIVQWVGEDFADCPKEDAVFAVAGRGFRWFNIHLGEFGLGPWAERYKDPEFLAKLATITGSDGASDAGRGDANAAPSVGSQSGAGTAIAQPSPPSHPRPLK